jgi:predicted transcriptional regulator
VVYASSPVSKVVGEFEIDEVLHEEIETLWEATKSYSGITRDFFFAYFSSRESGYAIKIKSFELYEDPMDLQSVYGSNPPQSFAYVD